MIRKPIEEYLNSLFNLAVIEDITQTKLEKAISYSLEQTIIKPRVKQEKSINFEFNFDILFRCPRSFAGVGFITLSLYNNKKRLGSMRVEGLDGVEIVENINNTEMIISKTVNAFVELEYNEVRSQIKEINFNEGLSCQKLY